MKSVRNCFTLECPSSENREAYFTHPTYLVVAVKLPTGAIELITNTTNIQSKIDYYTNAYDEEFRLKTNKEIQIVGYMIV